MFHLQLRVLLLALCILGVNAASFSDYIQDFLSSVLESEIVRQVKCFCRLGECFDTSFKPNIQGLRSSMKKRLYGQPLVELLVPGLLEEHLKDEHPEKPLVLSFNGWTGTGKNFVASLIADHMFLPGTNSHFVHTISAFNFPDKSRLDKYKKALQQYVHDKVQGGDRKLFIFDKVDKMPDGLLDVLNPYLDKYTIIEGVDFRKSIFIFISRTAGRHINEWTLKRWESGQRREGTKISNLNELDRLMRISSFNEPGGLYHSSIVEEYLISAFVPFLPLEHRHVKRCVLDHMVSDVQASQILDELMDSPSGKNVFSASGCKLVKEKAAKYRFSEL